MLRTEARTITEGQNSSTKANRAQDLSGRKSKVLQLFSGLSGQVYASAEHAGTRLRMTKSAG